MPLVRKKDDEETDKWLKHNKRLGKETKKVKGKKGEEKVKSMLMYHKAVHVWPVGT